MKTTECSSFTGTNVRVDFDLASGKITAMLPGTVDETGEPVAPAVFEMSPAEAVELAAGITAAGVSAAAHLLKQRTAGPVERVTDAGAGL